MTAPRLLCSGYLLRDPTVAALRSYYSSLCLTITNQGVSAWSVLLVVLIVIVVLVVRLLHVIVVGKIISR